MHITSLARLRTLDPEYATTLNPNDWYRLKRGLEICTLSGRYGNHSLFHAVLVPFTIIVFSYLARTVTSFKREFSEDGKFSDYSDQFFIVC